MTVPAQLLKLLNRDDDVFFSNMPFHLSKEDIFPGFGSGTGKDSKITQIQFVPVLKYPRLGVVRQTLSGIAKNRAVSDHVRLDLEYAFR